MAGLSFHFTTACSHITRVPYLRVYKPHFFDKNLPSKIGVRLIYGINKGTEILREKAVIIDDWAHDAGIVCGENPSRDRW
jgi:hypothetical protein